jgi:hypothetical protein
MKLVDFKKSITLSTLIIGALGAAANAQTSAPSTSLKTLGNYRPSVIPSEQEAQRIYQSMPTKTFKGSSGCFQRAHNWSYDLSRNNGIQSMKVFLFFTERYKREFDYEWMYHVAPLMPVRMNDGSISEMVFDPTFVTAPSWISGEDRKFFDNKPVSIERWIRYFVFPQTECPVVENYQDYFDYQERHYCYIMKTPMYTYIPENIDSESEVRTWWREGDLKQMKRAYKLDLNIDFNIDLNLNLGINN